VNVNHSQHILQPDLTGHSVPQLLFFVSREDEGTTGVFTCFTVFGSDNRWMKDGEMRVALRLWWMVIALGSMNAMAQAQINEGNLVKNPGFEEPAAEKGNSYLGWAFVNHAQDFIRGEIEAQDYHSGLKAGSVSVAENPRVYASWAQHIQLKNDSELPDQVSVWYRAPQNEAQVVLGFTGFAEGKPTTKGGASVLLPKSADWRQVKEHIDVPFGTRDIQLELRVSKPGEYRFDDVSLVRTERGSSSGKPDRILFVGSHKLTYLWLDALKQAGWQRVSYETWDNLTPELLKQTRGVVMVSLPLRPDLTPQDEATINLLADYVNNGGGLMLNQQAGQVITSMTLSFALARKFGTQILFEKTISDPALTKQVGVWGPDRYTYTEKLSGPVAAGVKGVLYQSTVDMQSLGGVMPFLPKEPWQVALSAGPTSRSEIYRMGLEEVDKNARAQGFASEVPLAGIREMGKGRVAYFGMLPDTVFARPIGSDDDRKVHEAYLTKGTEGFGSDLLKLYMNTFQWLSGNADNLAAATLTQEKVASVQYDTAWKSFRGIIGPRTSHSSGKSTPEEYVDQAKKAGFDFIVFLEDFAALKPGGFEALKAECRKLSDGKFLAIPGITYENVDGNHEFAFGKYLKMPSAMLLDATGKRFRAMTDPGPTLDLLWLYTLCGFENYSGWYRFEDNPYPHFDARDVNCMGVITQEGGKTVENVVLPSYAQEARNGQFLWPMALTLMQSAAEIDLVQKGIYYRNEVGLEGVEKLDKFLDTLQGRSARNLFPGAPCFGQVFLSNGPSINLSMPRGDTDAESNLWNPRLQEWPFELKVASPVGLREIHVMDGTARIRRFFPNGAKEFVHNASLPRERQKAIWIRAIDVEGHEAVSRDITSDSWLLRDTQCADRNNQLLYSMQARPDGTPFYVGYGGDTPMPDKGPWNGRTRPVGIFVFDKLLGVGAMGYDGSPEQHPQCHFTPSCDFGEVSPQSMGWASQLVAGKEGAAHVQPNRFSHSSDVLIGERILDGVFPVDAKPVIHVWHTLYPVKPSKYLKTTARQYLYLVKVDGISVYLWDQTFEVLQDIPNNPKKLTTLHLGYVGASTATERVIVSAGKTVDSGAVKGKPVESFPFNRGDYVGLLKSPFGSLAVYSLTDGLMLTGDGVNYGVGFDNKTTELKAGTKLRARVLMVGMHRMVQDPVVLAAKIAQDYGLSGAPAYQVAAVQGTAGPADYPLQLTVSKDACFKGKLTGVAELAGNLGVAVSGLRDNWTAFCQQQGAQPKTRIIAVEQGTGHAVLRAEDEGQTIFLGHPLIADNPDISLIVARTKDWKRWQVEIHNPTDKKLTVTVRSNPYVVGLKFTEKLTLPPGSSVIRDVGAA